MPPPLPRRNNDAEIQAFEAVCQRLAGFDEALHWEYVDGWLAALASGPALPPTEDWLAALCGDTFERVFADPSDRAQALRALKTRLAVLRDQLDPDALADDPDALHLEPLVAEWTDEDRAALVREGTSEADAARVLTGGLWASGAADGLLAAAAHAATLGVPDAVLQLLRRTLDEAAGAPPPGAEADPAGAAADQGGDGADAEAATLRDLLRQLTVLLLEPGSPAWTAHMQAFHEGQAPDRDALLDHALLALQDLRLGWVDLLPVPETRRVAPAPGRNDPCPCGSGKKYKKCHGAG